MQPDSRLSNYDRFSAAHTPLQAHEEDEVRLSSRLESALKGALPNQEAKPIKNASTLQKENIHKDPLLSRIILKSFLSDIVFGSKDTRASKEEFDDFNSVYRELVKGKDSKIASFRSIDNQKISIPYRDSSIAATRFTKGADNPGKPLALIITGSFFAPEVYAAPLVKTYLDQGFNVLVIDPVGFGESQQVGEPTPANFIESAECAANYIRESLKVPNNKVVIHGYSIGGFAAVHLASLPENDGMNPVLDRCAASAEAIAVSDVKSHLPPLIGTVVAKIAGSFVKALVPFNLRKTLPKVHGKVFLAQTDLSDDEKRSEKKRMKSGSSFALVEKLESKKALRGVEITKVFDSGEHMTNFQETWVQNPLLSTTIEFKKWLKAIG